MDGAWLCVLLACSLQLDLPLALGPLTVYQNELLLAILAAYALAEPAYRARLRPFAWAFVPLALWVLAHAGSAGLAGPLKAVLRAGQFALALALPSVLLAGAAERRLARRGLLLAASVSAVWALAQSLAGPGSALNAGREVEVIYGFQAAAAGFGHHNQLGAFLVAVLALGAAAFADGEEGLWLLAPLGLGLLALLCTDSRGAWIAAALALLPLSARLSRRAQLALGLTVLLAAGGAWFWPGGALRSRLQHLGVDSERDRHRQALLAAGEGHGLWGLGPQGMDEAVLASARALGANGEPHPAFRAHAHNSWLQWGLTWGWPVLALWFVALLPLWRALARSEFRSAASLALAGAVTGFGLQAWTDHLFLHARGAAVALVWGLLLASLRTEQA